MDPDTTLFTFLLQTHPSVQSVHLIGSWDNFSSSYTMERDSRRGRDQWRGCYALQDAILEEGKGCSPTPPYKRPAGLRMGHTYYYYYEIDGSTETHDPSLPSTTTCPYLPGQVVNTMEMPTERSLRQRSASLTSLKQANYRTMNPSDKFLTPRPAPTPSRTASPVPGPRAGSAPNLLQHHASCRSLSPSGSPAWKRIFAKKVSPREIGRGRSPEQDDYFQASVGPIYRPGSSSRSRSRTPSDGISTRDMSPESLRRFLSDDMPPRPDSNMSERPTVTIPENIVEELEDDDNDDNFATSATSESNMFATSLSPPPPVRPSTSSDAAASVISSTQTINAPTRRAPSPPTSKPSTRTPPMVNTQHSSPKPIAVMPPPIQTKVEQPSCSLTSSSSVTSPISPRSPIEPTSFFDATEDDDDDILSSNDEDLAASHSTPNQTFSPTFETYSLPKDEKMEKSTQESTGNNFLGSAIESGLDDFASELGWMVEHIGTRAH